MSNLPSPSSSSSSSSRPNPDPIFAKLKPICVQLLSLASPTERGQPLPTKPLIDQLERLRSALIEILSVENHPHPIQPSTSSSSSKKRKITKAGLQPILSNSLIHYIFFPIAQLLRSPKRGALDLPDRVNQHVFEVLQLLASQWWFNWSSLSDQKGNSRKWTGARSEADQEDWSVWKQLLILGTITLGGTPGKEETKEKEKAFSQETRFAASGFLENLLRPRFVQNGSDSEGTGREGREKASGEAWEWDGVSDLPSLDDLDLSDHEEQEGGGLEGERKRGELEEQIHLVFPTPLHFSFANSDPTVKGALTHLLTSSLEAACENDSILQLRRSSLLLAGHVSTTWIAGVVAKPPTGSDVGSRASWLEMVEEKEGLGTRNYFRILDLSVHPPPSKVNGVVEVQRSADRLCFYLPGIISSLVRLVTGKVRTKGREEGESAKNSAGKSSTPGELVAISLLLIRDTLLICLGDDSTAHLRAKFEDTMEGVYVGEANLVEEEGSKGRVRTLEDFANLFSSKDQGETGADQVETPPLFRGGVMELDAEDGPTGEGEEVLEQLPLPPCETKASTLAYSERENKEATRSREWLSTTLIKVSLALRNLSFLSRPSGPLALVPSNVHPLAQKALISLTEDLASEVGQGLLWCEEKMLQDDFGEASTTNHSGLTDGRRLDEGGIMFTLLTWLIDLSNERGGSESVRDRSREALTSIFDDEENVLKGKAKAKVRKRLFECLELRMMKSIEALTEAIESRSDDQASIEAFRLTSCLSLASGATGKGREESSKGLIHCSQLVQGLRMTLGPQGLLETWGDRLIRALRLKSDGKLEDDLGLGLHSWPPRPRLEHLENQSKSAILDMLREVGRAVGRLSLNAAGLWPVEMKEVGDEKARLALGLADFEVCLYFLREGARFRTFDIDRNPGGHDASDQEGSPLETGAQVWRTRSTSCLLIASEILRGCSEILDDERLSRSVGKMGRKLKKLANKLGKQVYEMVIEIWENDVEEFLRLGEDDGVEAGSEDYGGRRWKGEGKPGEGKWSGELSNPPRDHIIKETLTQVHKGLIEPTDPSGMDDGIKNFGPALNLSFVRHAKIDGIGGGRRAEMVRSGQHLRVSVSRAKRSIDLSNAFLFSLISSSSILLGTLFRPYLLKSLYPILSGLSSTNAWIAESARHAMEEISRSCAYASVQGCILDHADYILGSAAQRLVWNLGEELNLSLNEDIDQEDRLPADPSSDEKWMIAASQAFRTQIKPLLSSQSAPMVLVEVIRILGSEAVPLVEDALDEILDTLDKYHGFKEVCEGLLKVLDGVLDALSEENRQARAGKDESPAPEPKIRVVEDDRAPLQDDGEEEAFREFEDWFGKRRRTGGGDGQGEEEEDVVFEKLAAGTADAAGPSREGKNPDPDSKFGENSSSGPWKENGEANPPPPTKTQEVVVQIMKKSLPFLSHASPLIRSRVLVILRNGSEILGSQRRDTELLPIVNKAWPFVMSRLGYATTTKRSTDQGLGGGGREDILVLGWMGQGGSRRPFSGKDDRGESSSTPTESEPWVWIHSIDLISSLSKQAPDFLSKRLVQDYWPRLRNLLEGLQCERPVVGPSLLKSREGTTIPVTFRIGPYNVEDREAKVGPSGDGQVTARSRVAFYHSNSTNDLVLCSIIKGLKVMLRSVKERLPETLTWEILNHPTLWRSVEQSDGNEKLMDEATQLLQELRKRNPDAFWLAFPDWKG
ncbi:hypothetical protein IE53DRAFT_383141 [Violaceomyces palustris]|uniref:Uncharacterized protein n=1 Tax=Violaceomyces palustris TaxID=1673888 RepID=A0ACD0P8L7_9BASI|nr:hypothetical protein IE53DRAFT_383141 [Violaceomyces palustris]